MTKKIHQLIQYFWIVICISTCMLPEKSNVFGSTKLPQALTNQFNKLLKDHVHYDEIEKVLNEIDYTPVQVNSQDLVNEFSRNVRQLLNEKIKVVDKLKASVEQAKMNATNSGDGGDGDYGDDELKYNNMRDESTSDSLVYVDDFSTEFKVSLNHSFVQVRCISIWATALSKLSRHGNSAFYGPGPL